MHQFFFLRSPRGYSFACISFCDLVPLRSWFPTCCISILYADVFPATQMPEDAQLELCAQQAFWSNLVRPRVPGTSTTAENIWFPLKEPRWSKLFWSLPLWCWLVWLSVQQTVLCLGCLLYLQRKQGISGLGTGQNETAAVGSDSYPVNACFRRVRAGVASGQACYRCTAVKGMLMGEASA